MREKKDGACSKTSNEDDELRLFRQNNSMALPVFFLFVFKRVGHGGERVGKKIDKQYLYRVYRKCQIGDE